MLTSLHIKDFAIIDELEIDISSGMTVLTGETGAGKSILLDALGLLLGDRADSDTVRHGCKRAELNALFDLSLLDNVRHWLTEHALDQGDECILRRVIMGEGRSRAYINGTPVPAQSLRLLGEQLVDIHGQHEHQSLMKRSTQRELLDNYGNHHKILQQLQTRFLSWQDCDLKISEILGQDTDRESRLEFLRFQLNELDEMALEDGEIETLQDELKRLSNAERLLSSSQEGLDLLFDNENLNAHDLISKTLATLDELGKLDETLTTLHEPLNTALIQIEDAVERLRDYRDHLNLEPDRQQVVEQRLDMAHNLARKHRTDVTELLSLQQTLQHDLGQLEQAEEILQSLEKQRDNARDEYFDIADTLYKKRQKSAKKLSSAVSDSMQELGMTSGRFIVDVHKRTTDTPSRHGMNEIEFLVTANPGQPEKAITKVASGGELSRISLAIQVIAAKALQIPTLVFDEVDSGVGGSVAETVGYQLRALGTNRQVLCVTHLPQVAAQGETHLQVSKKATDSSTRTHIQQLSNEQRTEEIARMLGGRKITKSTRQHAREMLGLTTTEKQIKGSA